MYFWIVAAAGLALAGCNKAESPAEVQHDVTDARADAQRDVADAQADAREDMADAQKDVADAQADHDADDVADQAQQASETGAKSDYKVAVAQAEATHKVAYREVRGPERRRPGGLQGPCGPRSRSRQAGGRSSVATARADGSGPTLWRDGHMKHRNTAAVDAGGAHGLDGRGRLLDRRRRSSRPGRRSTTAS